VFESRGSFGFVASAEVADTYRSTTSIPGVIFLEISLDRGCHARGATPHSARPTAPPPPAAAAVAAGDFSPGNLPRNPRNNSLYG
jgi:hypothetical protein